MARRTSKPKLTDDKPLSYRERIFCAAYVAGGKTNAIQAWRETFGTPRGSDYLWLSQQAVNALLKRPEIIRECDRLVEKASQAASVQAKDIIERYAAIAFADPREISSFQYFNCRHCWGKDHLAMWTVAEFADAMDTALRRDEPQPPERGGVGFDVNGLPNPDCPECGGRGVGRAVFNDTRLLSPGAAALYAGTKETKNGLELQTHSQMEALKALSNFFGITPDTLRIFGIVAGNTDQAATSLTDQQQALLNEVLRGKYGVTRKAD